MYQDSVLPRQRYVWGPFGETGYVLKKPNHRDPTERRQQQRYKNRDLNHKAYKETRRMESDAFMTEYHKRLDILRVHSAVQRVVELGLEEADKELEQRRNRLRAALLEDESKYVAEYTHKAQTSLERKAERVKQIAEELEKKKVIADNLYVQRAYERIALEKDEEFRQKLQRRNFKNVSDARKAQMCEEAYSRILEVEENKIWDAMEEERIRKEKEEIEKAKAKEAERIVEMGESLKKQIEARERWKMNVKCMEELDDTRMREFLEKQTAEAEMREATRKETGVLQGRILEQQIAENKRIAESKRQEEVEMERIMMEDAHREIQREQAAVVDNRRQTWVELRLFKEANVQYQNALAERDAKVERMIEEQKRLDDKKNLLDRRMREIQRRNFANSCAQMSRQMVADKAKKTVEMKDLDVKYNQMLHHRITINEKLDQAKALFNSRVDNPSTIVLQNKQNEKYLEVLHQRERLEDQEMLEKMRNSREEMQSRIREAMDKPLPEISGISVHPFHAYVAGKAS